MIINIQWLITDKILMFKIIRLITKIKPWYKNLIFRSFSELKMNKNDTQKHTHLIIRCITQKIDNIIKKPIKQKLYETEEVTHYQIFDLYMHNFQS